MFGSLIGKAKNKSAVTALKISATFACVPTPDSNPAFLLCMLVFVILKDLKVSEIKGSSKTTQSKLGRVQQRVSQSSVLFMQLSYHTVVCSFSVLHGEFNDRCCSSSSLQFVCVACVLLSRTVTQHVPVCVFMAEPSLSVRARVC